MKGFRRPWFIAGLICVIALFSTSMALGFQLRFGKSRLFLLLGPACAVAAVLLLRWWLTATKNGRADVEGASMTVRVKAGAIIPH